MKVPKDGEKIRGMLLGIPRDILNRIEGCPAENLAGFMELADELATWAGLISEAIRTSSFEEG